MSTCFAGLPDLAAAAAFGDAGLLAGLPLLFRGEAATLGAATSAGAGAGAGGIAADAVVSCAWATGGGAALGAGALDEAEAGGGAAAAVVFDDDDALADEELPRPNKNHPAPPRTLTNRTPPKAKATTRPILAGGLYSPSA
jgi:hypothetical protein